MATFTKVSRQIPSDQRVALISDVAVGDRLDIEDILGRPGRAAQFNMTDTSDVLEYKLNTLRRVTRTHESRCDETVLIWSEGDEAYLYTVDGATVHETEEDLSVSSIEMITLTLTTGTTIQVVVW